MKLDSALYRNGAFLFAIFAAAIVWGFWPTYYAHPWKMPATRFHIHGILMSSWLLMLRQRV